MAHAELEILPRQLPIEEYRAAFDRDGFVAVDLFSADEVKRMRQMVHDLVASPSSDHPRLRVFAASQEPVPGLDPDNPYAVYKVVNTPLAGDDWFGLIMDPQVLGIVAGLIGPDVNFHMGFLRLRPPGLHVQEGWHRDFDSERHTSPGLITALTYLDEMPIESGPTQVVPGSHRDAIDLAALETAPIQVPEPDQIVHATARPGTVLFLDCLTVHSVADNRTSKNRSILLHEYKAADAVEIDENDAAFGDLPLARAGWTAQAPA
ncbi:MAG: phytanoyl-CoA dioxygenase family protein [Stackebrandtia sp.]